MASFFTLDLDTTPPTIQDIICPEIIVYPYNTFANVVISADKKLGFEFQNIYALDSKGARHDIVFSCSSGNLRQTINMMKCAAGPVALHCRVADEVGNQSEEVVIQMLVAKNLAIHFIPIGSRISKYILQPGQYKKGTAKLTPNSNQLVNKLWVKGGKALSDLYSQQITAGTDPIPLHYPPRAPVTVAIGGVEKTLGIQNIHEAGTHDFLLNAAEKLLVPDLCTAGTGTISYRYEYPIKILLDEPNSQQQYGVFEDILRVDTGDKDLALELGLRHLFKYSQPVISGSVEPFTGVYKPGEYILTQIPDLKIDAYLEIKEVTYDSVPGQARVDIKLQLESPDRDVSHILKDLSQRLFALEKAALKDDEGPVEYYIAREEPWAWLEANEVPPPIEAVGWWQWKEQTGRVTPVAADEEVIWRETIAAIPPVEMSEETAWAEALAVSQYSLFPAEDLYPADDLYPM